MKRLLHWINGRIITKFFCLILLAVILPMAVVSVLMTSSTEDYIYQERVLELEEQLQADLARLDSAMTVCMNIGMTFVRNDSFLAVLRQSESSAYIITNSFTEVLVGVENLNFEASQFVDITFIDQNLVAHTNWNDNTALTKRTEVVQLVEKAKAQQGFFFWETVATSSAATATIATPPSLVFALYDPQNTTQYLGTFIIGIKEDYLQEIFQRSQATESFVCLMSEEGESVRLDTGTAFPLPFDEVTTVTRATVSGRNYLVQTGVFPPVWQQGGQPVTVYRFVPTDAITATLTDYILQINLMWIVGIVSVLIIAFFIIRKLVTPLTLLSGSMIRYSEDQTVAPLDCKRADEIGDLNRAFLSMAENIERLIHNIQVESRFKEQYHYEALMAQLTPHFLFNTLNTIRFMALIQKADNIVQCIDSLANLLRYSMNKEGEIVSLSEELLQIQSYVDIQNFRYGNRVQLMVHVPTALQSLQVVKFALQPIVENCIKHGIDPKQQHGKIDISASCSDEGLYLTVTDNGAGIDAALIEQIMQKNAQETPPNAVTGIGIHHVHQRIKSLYGEDYGLELLSQSGQYTMVVVHLPIINPDNTPRGEADEKGIAGR